MRHYLDHAATSPLRPSALHAMTSAWSQIGNPSSQHTSGRAAHAHPAAAKRFKEFVAPKWHHRGNRIVSHGVQQRHASCTCFGMRQTTR